MHGCYLSVIGKHVFCDFCRNFIRNNCKILEFLVKNVLNSIFVFSCSVNKYVNIAFMMPPFSLMVNRKPYLQSDIRNGLCEAHIKLKMYLIEA